MYGYDECRISPRDKKGNEQMDTLLEKEGITRDGNLEYTMGVFDGDKMIATGSMFKNTLRCLAVDSTYRGEGLLNKVVTHLVNLQAERGNYHLFLYTKCDKTLFFKDLGFYEIARADGLAVFMENRKNGFSSYLDNLKAECNSLTGVHGAVVMNGNPFTLGHKYLVETAAKECDILHLFVVSEDASLVPFKVRYDLIKKGVSDIPNVVLHQTESYMISSATFPSYFIKDGQDVMKAQAVLDISVFREIAKAVNITKRFVGEEPFSKVTDIYNTVMKEELEAVGISLGIIPRKEQDGLAISASQVRQLIHDNKLEEIKSIVPQTTYEFFKSREGQEVIEKIKASDDIVHH